MEETEPWVDDPGGMKLFLTGLEVKLTHRLLKQNISNGAGHGGTVYTISALGRQR